MWDIRKNAGLRQLASLFRPGSYVHFFYTVYNAHTESIARSAVPCSHGVVALLGSSPPSVPRESIMVCP